MVDVDVDFYLADPQGLLRADATYPDGFTQGLVYLATRRVDGQQDTDPDANEFQFAGVPGLTAQNMSRLICAAHYTINYNGGTVVQSTSLFSLPPASTAIDLDVTAIPLIGADELKLSWLGGNRPFVIQRSTTMASGNWVDLVTTESRTFTTPMSSRADYFRVKGSAAQE